jgi:hypothetical protein
MRLRRNPSAVPLTAELNQRLKNFVTSALVSCCFVGVKRVGTATRL